MSDTGHGDLIARLARALDDGTVRAADLERLLARPRPGAPTASGVLTALGGVVVFIGFAIAYATIFDDLDTASQVVTPFLFPLVALGVSVALARRHGPGWRSDVAGITGFVALAAAIGTSFGATDAVDSGRPAAAAVAVAAVVSGAIVVLVHRLTGSERLLWVGMPAALAVLGIALAHLAGAWDEGPDESARLGVVILVEALVAAAVAAALARRGRDDAIAGALWAVGGAYAAVMLSGYDPTSFEVWHAVLAATVVAAFLVAAALESDALTWLGAAGGAWWVVTIAIIVGSATGAALAVVLGGAALAGLGLLVARLRRD